MLGCDPGSAQKLRRPTRQSRVQMAVSSFDDTPAKPGTECEADAVKDGDKMRLLM